MNYVRIPFFLVLGLILCTASAFADEIESPQATDMADTVPGYAPDDMSDDGTSDLPNVEEMDALNAETIAEASIDDEIMRPGDVGTAKNPGTAQQLDAWKKLIETNPLNAKKGIQFETCKLGADGCNQTAILAALKAANPLADYQYMSKFFVSIDANGDKVITFAYTFKKPAVIKEEPLDPFQVPDSDTLEAPAVSVTDVTLTDDATVFLPQ